MGLRSGACEFWANSVNEYAGKMDDGLSITPRVPAFGAPTVNMRRECLMSILRMDYDMVSTFWCGRRRMKFTCGEILNWKLVTCFNLTANPDCADLAAGIFDTIFYRFGAVWLDFRPADLTYQPCIRLSCD